MRYQGGKSRIAKALATEIRKRFPTTTDIWELFCGGGAMTLALAKAGFRVHASDNHEDLILMWQALMRGETDGSACFNRACSSRVTSTKGSEAAEEIPAKAGAEAHETTAGPILKTAKVINHGKKRNEPL